MAQKIITPNIPNPVFNYVTDADFIPAPSDPVLDLNQKTSHGSSWGDTRCTFITDTETMKQLKTLAGNRTEALSRSGASVKVTVNQILKEAVKVYLAAHADEL